MLVVNSDATDCRLGRNLAGKSSGVIFEVLWGSVDGGIGREFVEESSKGSVRDSLFIFRRDGGFVVDERKGNRSDSDAAEEAAEVEAELLASVRAICGFWTGVSKRRAVGGPFLRGIEFVDDIIFEDCGLE